ncbi:hypothetical protein WJ74_17925 [Burkholderia ubonensis]|uniref:hypothetical protein n=1 Tax=Burkholderia ubonensis TaxID=101571 RepID=UPI00076DE47E|nr:hypothetical protein [Burkholderia ubonensis]KVO33363.1 hypothetical protein WJ74_17925 [Burkholderia ubonensis]
MKRDEESTLQPISPWVPRATYALNRQLLAMQPRLEPTLPPPKVPAAGNRDGIGVRELDRPQMPVQVTMYYSRREAGDLIEVYWANDVTPAGSIVVSNPDIFILTVDVLPDRIGSPQVEFDRWDTVFYRVTSPRPGGNQAESHPTPVRVKTSVPGRPNPNPGTPWNDNLAPVEGLPAKVEGDVVTRGLTLTVRPYVNQCEGDLLTLHWGSRQVRVRVQSRTQPTEVFVSPDVIRAEGDVKGMMVVYGIYDEVGNWSLYSMPATTDVDTAESNLSPPPFIVDAQNGNIDLTSLGTKDVEVLVPVYNDHAVGQQVELEWIGRTEEGVSVPVTLTGTVDRAGFPLSFEVPNAAVAVLGGGRAQVRYHAIGEHSTWTQAGVVGQARPILAAPTVDEAHGGVLDPAAVPERGARVRITEYRDMMPGDEVQVSWLGKTASGASDLYQPDPIPVWAIGDVTVDVPKEHVTLISGGRVEVWYQVTRGDGTTLPDSPVLGLTVAGRVLDLPKPRIDRLSGGVLDPDGPVRETIARVPSSAGLIIDDRLTLVWQGATQAGTFTRVLPITNTWAGREIPFTVPLDVLQANDGGTVNVWYTVLRNGTMYTSPTESFRVGSAFVPDLPQPRVKEAVGNSLPANAPQATIVVPEGAGLRVGDQVFAHWTGRPGAGTPDLEPKIVFEGMEGRALEIAVPASAIAANEGSEVRVEYQVVRGDGGGTQDSEPYTLRVETTMDLRIESVRNSFYNKEIPNGGTTVSTELTLRGKAKPNRDITLWDGETSHGNYRVDGSGNWTVTLTDLRLGQHSFTARALYDDNPVSTEWNVLVDEPFEYTSQFGPGSTQVGNWTIGAAAKLFSVTSIDDLGYVFRTHGQNGQANGEQLFTHFYLKPGTYVLSYQYSNFTSAAEENAPIVGMTVDGKDLIPPIVSGAYRKWKGRIGLLVVDGDTPKNLRFAVTVKWVAPYLQTWMQFYQFMIRQVM